MAEGKRCIRNWADLHGDLLFCIAERLQSIKDYVVFRSVCAAWRSAAAKDKYKNRFPWLLLPKLEDDRQILAFNNGKFEQTAIMFPEGRINTLCLGTKGWILAVTQSGTMYLQHILNPNSRILLPSKNKLQEQKYGRVYIRKAALSSSPDTTNYTLVLMFGHYNAVLGHQLAFWRPGDETYTKTNVTGVHDLIYGRDGAAALCFAITLREVFSIDFTSQDPSATRRRVGLLPNRFGHLFLVESEGELFIICRTCESSHEQRLIKFYVSRVSETGEWQEIKDLGNRAFFIGRNVSFSLDNASPGYMPNHIYFTTDSDDKLVPHTYFPHCMGILNLENGAISYSCCSPYERVCTFPRPSLWVQQADFSSW